MTSVKKYVSELRKVLMGNDYHKLVEFTEKYGYSDTKEMLKEMNDKSLEIAFHKMRLGRTDIPERLKNESRIFLIKHGCRTYIL